MVTEGDVTRWRAHTAAHTLWFINRTCETYITLLNSVTPNRFNFKNNKNKLFQNSHGGELEQLN